MILLLALLIIVAVAFAVAYPLWKTKPAPKVVETGPNDELLSQKETTYAALKELDFDYALGNLTQEDHKELGQKYKNKAITILKQIDEGKTKLPKPRSAEEQLEAEILQLRRAARKAQPLKAGAETSPSLRQLQTSAPPQAKIACPHCHSQIPSAARYCPYCGSSLKPLVCAKCSTPYSPGQRFCSQCGAPLTEEKGK